MSHFPFFFSLICDFFILLFFKMERTFENIKDVNDKKELWKLVFKISHKSNVLSNQKEYLEMIFVLVKKYRCV